MAYTFTEARIYSQPIANTETTQATDIPVGTMARAVDPTFGAAEFIYLLGVASTAIGSLVTYNLVTGATALAPIGANKPQPIAVAMSANVAAQYGWYQISGIAVCKKQCTVSLAANATVGILSAGLIAGTASGKEIQGALVAVVASAAAGRTSVQVVMNRPHMMGRVS